MRSSLVLLVLGSLALPACGGAKPSAAPTAAPAASASAVPAVEMAPTPYTAAQLREASAPGSFYRYRVEAAKEPLRFQEMLFVKADAEGADVQQTTRDEKDAPVGESKTHHAAWEALQKHAEFPKSAVTLVDERVTVPAGAFDCTVYTVTDGDEVVRYSFAKQLPGPPVLIVADKAGTRILTQTLLVHRPGKR